HGFHDGWEDADRPQILDRVLNLTEQPAGAVPNRVNRWRHQHREVVRVPEVAITREHPFDEVEIPEDRLVDVESPASVEDLHLTNSRDQRERDLHRLHRPNRSRCLEQELPVPEIWPLELSSSQRSRVIDLDQV